MNLYDEAIEEATWHGEIEGPQTVRIIIKALERAKKVEELVKSYEVLVHDYEQLLETKDKKEWSLLRFHIIELKRIIDKRMEEMK